MTVGKYFFSVNIFSIISVFLEGKSNVNRRKIIQYYYFLPEAHIKL